MLLVRILAAAKARAGRAFIFPTPLFLPAPAERSVWRAKRAVSSVQKMFGFCQTNARRYFRFLIYDFYLMLAIIANISINNNIYFNVSHNLVFNS